MKKQKTFQTNKQNIHGQETYAKRKCSMVKEVLQEERMGE